MKREKGYKQIRSYPFILFAKQGLLPGKVLFHSWLPGKSITPYLTNRAVPAGMQSGVSGLLVWFEMRSGFYPVSSRHL